MSFGKDGHKFLESHMLDIIDPWEEMEALELPDDDTLNRMLERVRGLMFLKPKAGFLGTLLCDHEFLWDDTQPTAWCDGTWVGINRRLFFWLTVQERVTLIAHEIWHTGFQHMVRLGLVRCPDIWNQAADYVINLMLKDAGYTFGPKLMSLKPCLDDQYRNMSSEQVYDLLPKPPSGGSGPINLGSLASDLKQPKPGTMEKIMGNLVKATQVSKQSDPGNLPGEIELILEKFLNPILPWEVLLARFMTDISRDDYSWRRPSRRNDDEYLPSLLGENGLEHLIYYIDISGSVTDQDILRFNSEVKHIHEELRPKRLTLVTFDDIIQDTYEFTEDMPFEKIVVHGRGGTDLDPVRKHILKYRPTAAVIFSDLFVHPMSQDPGYPILWVVVGNSKAQVKFGQKIHIRNEAA